MIISHLWNSHLGAKIRNRMMTSPRAIRPNDAARLGGFIEIHKRFIKKVHSLGLLDHEIKDLPNTEKEK